jgi:hypothetical protein
MEKKLPIIDTKQKTMKLVWNGITVTLTGVDMIRAYRFTSG